jgi:hypothetical protein
MATTDTSDLLSQFSRPQAGPRPAAPHEPPGVKVKFERSGWAIMVEVERLNDGRIKLIGVDAPGEPIPTIPVAAAEGWQSLPWQGAMPEPPRHLLVWGWSSVPPASLDGRQLYDQPVATMALAHVGYTPPPGTDAASVQRALDHFYLHKRQELEACLLPAPYPPGPSR